MEALKGKQHKIDKNGQIDSHDFKLLRKEEADLFEAGPHDPDFVEKSARHERLYTYHKRMGNDTEAAKHKAEIDKLYKKEETEQLEEATVKTQKYSWGTMKTVHHGSDFSIPLHPEHHKEIAKLKDQQEHKFKTEDGKHWTAKRSGDDVHFQGANGGNSTTVKHSTMSESVEELDEIRRMKTKLNKLDDVSNKSVARQKLSNLMKSGKARGALIANKMRTLNMGEEVEQIDEKSAQAFRNKINKNVRDIVLGARAIRDSGLDMNPEDTGHKTKYQMNKAAGRALRKEESEQVDETWSKDQLASIHSMHDKMSKSVGLDPSKKYGTIITKKKSSTDKAMDQAIKDEMKEEVEQIDELSPKTLGSYVKKATSSNDARSISNLSSKAAYKLATTDGEDEGEEEDHKSYKRSASISKAVNRLTKEEVEQIEERNKQNAMMRKTMDASRGARYKLNNPVPDAEPEHKTAQAHNKAIGRALRNEDKMTTTKDKAGKLISFKYEGDWKKSTEKKQGSGKAANLAGQAMQKMAKANEQAPVAPVPDRKYIKGTPENKALKAARKPINGMPTNKIKEEKDEQEYGYEGDMALNQLATLTRCAEMIKEILKPDTDMPEWVQSKITLATDYIQTAADYMHSEMNEAKSVEVKVNAAGDAAHEEKWEAVKKIKKPVKESFDDEGNLIANKVSYKEFMLEYTPGPGGVTQIKGRSYGASYSDPEGADDYDDKKPIKPAAEKRGRGRPAGAKSGARKITGTSKLMNK